MHNYVTISSIVYVSPCREEAGKAVTTLCEIAARKSGLNNPIWLGASVLAHFLSGASEPFSQIDPSRVIAEVTLELQNPTLKEVRERKYSKEARYVDLMQSTFVPRRTSQHESRVHECMTSILFHRSIHILPGLSC